MVAGPTLFPELAEVKETSINYFVYWRRPDGWLIAGPGWPQEYTKRIRNGWQHLSQYGSFTPGRQSVDARGIPFDAAHEGWRVLFQKGGAKEFPLEQIVAHGWHIRPPYREVSFPQLEGVEIEVMDCPECECMPFYMPRDLATHLRIRHDYRRQDIVALGDEAGINFRSQGRPAWMTEGGVLEQAGAEQVTEAEAPPRAQEYVCGIDGCTWAPTEGTKRPDVALAAHQKNSLKHRVAPDGGAPEGVTDGIHPLSEGQQE